MPVEPYLMFNGRCEEAIEFYKKVLGAEVLMMMRFKEPGTAAARHGAGGLGQQDHAQLRAHRRWECDGIRRLQRGGEFSGILIVAPCGRRSRRASKVRRAGRRRTSADAARQDLLVALLRHGRRPLWRCLDGHRPALRSEQE